MNGWKTLSFNGVIGGLALAGEIADGLEMVDLHGALPDRAMTYAVIGITVLNVLLRHMTKGPAGWAKE